MRFSPEELNLARQHLLDRIVEYFLTKKSVEALYIQGSVAANSADEFSDIDFRVVIQPELYEQIVSERFSAPRQWGEWLYNEWAGNPWVCVSHYQPFNKVDVLYFQPKELKPSPWYLLPTQLIYDPQDLVKEVIQASYGLEYTLDIREVDRLISKGLAYAEEVYRRVMRGELFYAQSQLDSFRGILIQFDDYDRKSLPSSGLGSPSHFEQRGSKTLIEGLKLSYATLDKQSILYALGELLKVYQHQVVKLHETLSLQRDKATDLSWIHAILQLCDTSS
ncbi:MAG: nucleotidyltransferase domain-containing protein [Xenococcaceae cyanobacterium MO_188.B29]|nr:nucleotidyltransferase domain-containing protein [Xenococcaceae cyanobacterium MO_188.B29]